MSIFEKIANLLRSRIQISIIPQSKGGFQGGGFYNFSQLEEIEETEESLEVEETRHWIEKVYSFDLEKGYGDSILSGEMKNRLREHRFTICNILLNATKLINSTLTLEQKKLVSKDVYSFDGRVLLDEPKDEELGKLEFTNNYIKFLDNGIAFKLNTRYLNNRKHLLQIGREILNDQKFDILKNATYQEIGSKTWSQLFSSFDITKIDDSWYILVKYTPKYINEISRNIK